MQGITRRATAVAAACAAAVSAGIAGAGPAAATGWVITPGGVFSATASPWQAGDVATGNKVVCTSLKLTGTLQPGQVPGPVIGTFSGAVASSCTVAGILPATLTFAGLPWTITPTSYDSGSGTVVGTLGGLRVHLAAQGCVADLGGATSGSTASVPFSYRNATHSLVIGTNGTVHAWNVSCLGLISNGDAFSFGGTFDVEPPQSIVPAV